MKAPVESAFGRSARCFDGCGLRRNTVWTARAAEAAGTDSAPPGACGAAIAQLETALNEARTQWHVVASASESVGTGAVTAKH
jgi:hypothetical protein